jgi:hypothetical protein
MSLRSKISQPSLLAITLILVASSLEVPVISAQGVQALSQPELPVQLIDVALHSNIVTRTATLEYTVQNRGPHSINRVRLLVFVLDISQRVRAFERTCQELLLAPNQEQTLSLRLSNLLYRPPTIPGQVVVAVEGAQGPAGGWKVGLTSGEFLSAIRSGAAMAGAKLIATPQTNACDADYCKTCKNDAIELCGSRGVESYSCTVGQQSCGCTFECSAPPQTE